MNVNARKRLRLSFHIVLVSLATASAALAGVNSFTVAGPDGGAVTVIAAQPGQPNVVLASSARGTYRSTNAGASWTVVQPDMRGNADVLVFDPLVSTRVFVLSGQVWRSTDSGQTFTQVTNYPSGLDRMSVAGDRLYAASGLGAMYRSMDAGTSWTPLPVPWNTTTGYKLYGMAAAPGNAAILYVCIQEQGTFKSVDSGNNWTGPIAGSPCTAQFNWADDISVSPADPNRVLASTSDGLFLSTNGGTSWSVVFSPPFIRSTVFDPLAPNNVLGLDSLGLVKRSVDGGLNWLASDNGANLRVYNLNGGAFTGAVAGEFYAATSNGPMYSDNNGASFASRFNGIHASDGRELIASDDGTIYAMFYSGPAGVHRRSNGVWTSADNAELITRTGLPLNVIDIATAATNSNLLYLADQGFGVFRSDNGGADWSGPLPSLVGTQIFGIDVDPTNPQVVYAIRASGGLMRSANGGASFANCGLPLTTAIRHLYISRSAPNEMYAFGAYSSTGSRTWKSIDSCTTWAELTPSSGAYLYDVAIDPVNANRVFRTHIAGAERSMDGGATWTPVSFDFGTGQLGYGVRLLIDPVERNTLWVVNSNQAGFARSVDNGATWQRSVHTWHGNQAVFEAAVLDPQSPGSLIAVSRSLGIVEYQVAPDLAASLTLPTGTIFTGTPVQVTATVSNLGPMDASAVRVTLNLPASATLSSTPSGCTLASRTLTCRVAPLRLNQSVNIPLTLAMSATPSADSVTMTVAGHESDPATANNSASGSLQSVSRADLLLSGPNSTLVGHTTSTDLAFVLANHGPDVASNVRLTFTLPIGLDAVSTTLPGGTCGAVALLVTCTLNSLAVDASVTAQLRVTGAVVGTHTVSAQARSDGIDTDIDQNTTASVQVLPFADLSVELSTGATSRDVGTAFSYTATVRNAGPDGLRAIVDLAATGATLSTATTTSGACTLTAGAARCDLGEIASGNSVAVTLMLNTTAAGTASVQADVTWIGLDPITTNNHATLNTTIVTPPPPPSSSSSSSGGGGGGGGGRFDGVALAALALLAAFAWRRRTIR